MIGGVQMRRHRFQSRKRTGPGNKLTLVRSISWSKTLAPFVTAETCLCTVHHSLFTLNWLFKDGYLVFTVG